jgi:RNA polymerase sporulation-specific sigma factor
MEARNILIERNLRLVAHIAKKYYNVGNSCDNEDIISVGTIGLIKAIDSFDISNGTRFATYAGKCLQNEILMYFRAKKKFAAETSLSDAVETDKDGNPLTYMDIISCEDTIADDLDLKMRSQQMIKALNRVLDDREREIIILRYGLCEGKKPLTQREVAEQLKISRSYVSRLEKSALGKLKKELSECKQNYFSL